MNTLHSYPEINGIARELNFIFFYSHNIASLDKNVLIAWEGI